MRFLPWLGLLGVLAFGEEEDVSHRPADGPNLDLLTEEDTLKITKSQEKHEFQAEISRLMDIIVNSLYTNKEVFIRELISNAADALEKVRFLGVSTPAVLDANSHLEIYVEIDKDAKTLCITDTGIGMTRTDLISNLGTVAKSGSSNFLEAMSHGEADVNLIGQFGVGFYSSFLVSDRVTVVSRHPDDDQHIWESSADASFVVAPDPRGNSLLRGTRVTLHLREDSQQFLDPFTVETLLKKNSEFVQFPLFFKKIGKDGTAEWEKMNPHKAIWLRPKDEIKEDEYKNFYKTIWKDTHDPLSYNHFSAEGEVEFRSILYIPTRGDDMYSRFQQANNPDRGGGNVRLYVRRVLIGDDKLRLLPPWLNFVTGVVDSDDLPLKVDREQLSQSRVLLAIQKKLVAKTLEMFRTAAKESDEEASAYDRMVKEYESFLFLGCIEDENQRSKLVKLLRFKTSKSDRAISLDRYIARMPAGQESIYFLAGESEDIISNSPFLEPFKKRNYEVLYLTDALGEACLERVRTYESKVMLSIEKGTEELIVAEDESLIKQLKKSMAPFCGWWRDILESSDRKVKSVKPSLLLVESPALVSTDTWGMSGHYEKIMRSQAWFNEKFYESQLSGRSLDVNPKHPIIKKLYKMWKGDPTDDRLVTAAQNIFDAAQLAAGHIVKSPAAVALRAMRAVAADMDISGDELKSPETFTLLDITPTNEDEISMDKEMDLGREMDSEMDLDKDEL